MHKNVKLKTSPVYKENFTSIKRCIKMLSQKLAKKFTSIKICIKMLS